ncbi:MAG: transcriptional repressor LexA [Flavobacteriaceae bacterium]|nr:transcriptional repressor LexA [Flavobacteriaceae bacterium]
MFNEISKKELQAVKIIRKYLFDFGNMPSVRELMRELEYKSPRSAAVIINNLEEKGILSKKEGGSFQLTEFKFSENFGTREQTIKIPLLGNVACGLPIFAEENVEAQMSISIKLIKKGHKYFLLRAKGDSMNEAGINDGDLVLIRQQQHAENGDKVLALINEEATIKEYHHKGSLVVLKPKSTNKKYQPIILTNEFRIQGVVEAVISI